MKVRIRRRGGIAGNVSLTADLDTGELSPDRAEPLHAALGRLAWGAPAPVPAHPDAFRYELSLPEDAGRGTAVLGEDDVDDDAFTPLLDRLRSAGTLD